MLSRCGIVACVIFFHVTANYRFSRSRGRCPEINRISLSPHFASNNINASKLNHYCTMNPYLASQYNKYKHSIIIHQIPLFSPSIVLHTPYSTIQQSYKTFLYITISHIKVSHFLTFLLYVLYGERFFIDSTVFLLYVIVYLM